MKNRLGLYFGLILCSILKIILCFCLILSLILFSPIFLFTNRASFYWTINELHKSLRS